MEVFLASLVVFGLAVLGMSLGTIFGGRQFQGSCRGACGHCDHTAPHRCQDGHGPQFAQTAFHDSE